MDQIYQKENHRHISNILHWGLSHPPNLHQDYSAVHLDSHGVDFQDSSSVAMQHILRHHTGHT